MTERQKVYKRALIQAVHLSKKYRSWFKDHRDEYEDAMRTAFGKKSSTHLSIDELVIWLDWLNEVIDDLPEHNPSKITQRQTQMLNDLWSQYAIDKSEASLLRFVAKIVGRLYLNIGAVQKSEATKCILALKKTLGGKHGR